MNKIKGYKFNGYFIDLEENQLYKSSDNQKIKLSDNEFKILFALVEKHPNLVSKKDLLEKIGYPDLNTTSPSEFENSCINKLYKGISTLRSKLPRQSIIHEEAGYCFNHPVEIVYDDNIYNSAPKKINQEIQTLLKNEVREASAVKAGFNWKKAFYASTLVGLVLFIIILLMLVTRNQLDVASEKNTNQTNTANQNNSHLDGEKDDGLTKLTIDKADVHLDMTNGWKDLNETERDSNQSLSKATVFYNYRVRKYFNTETFSHRVGTSRIISPKWVADVHHPIVDVEDIEDITKKCSNSARISKMLYFDIDKEPTNQAFDLMFSIDYFNAHNQKQKEYQNYFIHRPIELLEFKVSFPRSIQFPKAIRLLKAQNCFDEFIEQKKFNKAINSNDYAVENKGNMTITWYVKKPTVNNIYRIEWDWQ